MEVYILSYFLFGSFDTALNEEIRSKIKNYSNHSNVYFHFDEEIDFYDDIIRMCEEQNIAEDGTIFAVTSKNQPCNSSDLLFPFDKYSNEYLFSDLTRKTFNETCKINLKILFDALKYLICICDVHCIKIIVVEGYDDKFLIKNCTLEEMQLDVLQQIVSECYIESIIYCIE